MTSLFPFFRSLHSLDPDHHIIMNPMPTLLAGIPACDPVGKSITAITPTGDRPLAFALCQQWMKNQTVQPDQWIVIDDGKMPMKPSVPMQYVRREPQPNDPKHTLNLNLKIALPLIKGDKVIIIEDDEYYAPGYVAEMARRLDQYEAVGIMRAKYYHIVTGNYATHGNIQHASLAETSFRSSVLPEFKRLLDENSSIFLDIRLWQAIRRRGYLFVDANPLYLGMKGLPGRGGIGGGHKTSYYRNIDMADKRILKQWIPKDYQIYLDILNGKLTGDNYQSYFPSITGITVCYNTKELIGRAYNSVRKFHPDMPIIIIDGSDPGDPCASYIKSLASNITTIISLGYNIGHGRGMCKGIDLVRTPYALIFDSDIEMLKSPVQAMLEMMEEDTFGVGYTEKVGFDGYEYGVFKHHAKEGWMPYLHPYFQLININNYKKFHPYVHHGAPCYLTMLDIYKKGLSDKIIKEFPGLGHSSGRGWVWVGSPKEYIRHDHAGTRGMRRKQGMKEIEEDWVFNKGLV